MAIVVRHTFSEIFSRSVVVCLLALFVIISLIAMISTSGIGDEMGWIGMTAKSLDGEAAAALGIPSDTGGVMVGEVDGIAKRAGIRHGDVLLGINGQPVRDMGDFSRLVEKTDFSRGGVQFDIVRRGVRMPVFVLPSGPLLSVPGGAGRRWPGGAAEAPGAAPGGIIRAPAVVDRRWLGIEAETFRAGEGRELGIPAGVMGVLIDGVGRGGLAEQAGLAVNDVVVSVNGRKIDTTADLWNALAGLNGGDRVEFSVYRRGRLVSVALPVAMGTPAGGFTGRGDGWGAGQGRFPFCPTRPLIPAALPPASATPAAGFPGRMGGWGLGPGGVLACPNCGTKVTHQRGVPCYSVLCPSCGTPMIRAQ